MFSIEHLSPKQSFISSWRIIFSTHWWGAWCAPSGFVFVHFCLPFLSVCAFFIWFFWGCLLKFFGFFFCFAFFFSPQEWVWKQPGQLKQEGSKCCCSKGLWMLNSVRSGEREETGFLGTYFQWNICSIKITFLMTTAEILGSQSVFLACRSSEAPEICCWAEYNLFFRLHSEKYYLFLELTVNLDNFVDLLHRFSIGIMSYISKFILFI